jgi:hypothetical protein
VSISLRLTHTLTVKVLVDMSRLPVSRNIHVDIDGLAFEHRLQLGVSRRLSVDISPGD